MKALVYKGIAKKSVEERPNPKIVSPTAHRFKFDRVLDAYEAFANAATTRALKVLIEL